MRKLVAILVVTLLGVIGLLLSSGGMAADKPGEILRLQINGPIGPATAEYIQLGLQAAATRHAELVLIQMDTPGGLSSAMREIIKGILASPVPVVTYVAPSGSRAASAGTYILYASHIAAMAPATELGAATPVQLVGDKSPTPAKPETAEDRKILNDAVAYIRGLAARRGRNADWAEQAVRNAASLTASDALKQHVIDLMADNTRDLLAKLDGRQVTTSAGSVTLHTAGLSITDYSPGLRVKFLAVLTDPTVAYILLLIGIYGLVFEGYNPGGVLPGVAGGIALLLALYAFNILPVNFAGLALIALGILLFVTETFVPAYGTLTIGGLIAFVIGSIILMNTGVPGFDISRGVIGGVSSAAGLMVVGTLWLAMRAHRKPVVSGAEEMIGSTGKAMVDFSNAGDGIVRVHSENWNAWSRTPLRAGTPVRVIARDGLKLTVEETDNEEQ
ncbi:MAG TPA: nodulation protein NfeD [Gammaproteobacteria bacterium]|nr:nodulation protein NfeD [Gammaproteobacteria bacterium]